MKLIIDENWYQLMLFNISQLILENDGINRWSEKKRAQYLILLRLRIIKNIQKLFFLVFFFIYNTTNVTLLTIEKKIT